MSEMDHQSKKTDERPSDADIISAIVRDLKSKEAGNPADDSGQIDLNVTETPETPPSDADVIEFAKKQLGDLIASGELDQSAAGPLQQLIDPKQRDAIGERVITGTDDDKRRAYDALSKFIDEVEKLPSKNPQDERKKKSLISLLLMLFTWLMTKELNGRALESVAGKDPGLNVIELIGGKVFEHPEAYGISDLHEFCKDVINDGHGTALLEQIEDIPRIYHNNLIYEYIKKHGGKKISPKASLMLIDTLPKCSDLDEKVSALLLRTNSPSMLQAVLDNLNSFKPNIIEQVLEQLLNKKVTLKEVLLKIIELQDEAIKKEVIIKIFAKRKGLFEKMWKYIDVETLKTINALIPDLRERIADVEKVEKEKKRRSFWDMKEEHRKKEKVLELSPEETEELFKTLETRFKANMYLHEGVNWDEVITSLKSNPEAILSLSKMESAGHEPDLYHADKSDYYFGTCSKESPKSGRNITYKEAEEMAINMGITLMSPENYKNILQQKGKFDNASSSWLLTQQEILSSGVALDGDRYGSGVDVRQYGAGSHSDGGAWRGSLRVKKS